MHMPLKTRTYIRKQNHKHIQKKSNMQKNTHHAYNTTTLMRKKKERNCIQNEELMHTQKNKAPIYDNKQIQKKQKRLCQ